MLCRKEKKQLKLTRKHNLLIQELLSKIKVLKVKYEDKPDVLEKFAALFLAVSDLEATGDRGVEKELLHILEDIEMGYAKAVRNNDFESVETKLKRAREILAK